MNWDQTDYVVAGVLIFILVLGLGIVVKKVKNTNRRIIFGLLVLAIFILTWAELAVGIFGTPFAGN